MTEPPRQLPPGQRERLRNLAARTGSGTDEGGTRWGRRVPGSADALPGKAGGAIEVVLHGDDPDVLRPPAPIVYWIGAAQPTFGLDYDFWYTEDVT